MSFTENLYPASFRGVSFFVKTEARDGGRKLKIYEHPLADNRTVQDLGWKQPIYSLQAMVVGENYLTQARKLRIACEQEFAGKLTIPSFGIFQAVCTRITESVSEMTQGIVTFDLTFAVEQTQTTKSFTTKKVVNQVSGQVLNELTNDFAENYIVPTSTNNKDVVKNDLEQMATDISENLPNTETDTDSFLNKLDTIITDVDELTTQLMREGLLGTVLNSLPNDGSFYGTVKKLWTFGNTLTTTLPYLLEDVSILTNIGVQNLVYGKYHIPVWLTNTKNRRTRTANRLLLVASVRAFGVICALDQAAKTSYSTIEQIQSRVDEIEDAFDNIVYDDTLDYSSTVINRLEEMKTVCYSQLDEKRQRAYKIEEASIKGNTTSALLAYQLYYEEIVDSNSILQFNRFDRFLGDINTIQRRDKLSGTVNVLEVGRG